MLNHPLFTVLVAAFIAALGNPLFQVLMAAFIAALGNYLLNQLPPIREFPGKNALIIKLTIEVLALGGIYGWWNATSDKSDALKVLFKTVSCIILVFLVRHIFQLVRMLWRTRRDSNSITPAVNTTTTQKTLDDWRRELLKAIEIDVTKRLCDSLHNQEIIRLQMENRKEEVGRSQPLTINNNLSSALGSLRSQRLLKVFGVSDTQLEAGKPIIEVFEQPDIAGRLLILGAAGSGKTTMLLELTRDLIKRAEQEPNQPIPVLFELSNWKDDKQAIPDWLMADLKFRHQIPEAISRHWLDTDKLLPLLDGLDELGLPRQQKCIERINEFLQYKSSLLPLVVCCREEEYIKAEAILSQLRGAVCLQALTSNQIQNYLRQLGCFHLWQSIQDDPEGLGELAKMPLFLYLIPAAYPEGLVKQGQQRFNSADERQAYQERCRQELFDVYINRRLEEHHNRQGYELEDTKHWLKWLAKTHKQKEFYIENMQPTCLKKPSQKVQYRLLVGLLAMLTSWVIIFFSIFIGQQTLKLHDGLLGLVVGFWVLVQEEIKPVETLGFSWKNFLLTFRAIFLPGMVFFGIILLATALMTGLYAFIIKQLTVNSILIILLSIGFILIIGLFSISLLALINALGIGLRGRIIPKDKRKYPNQGIRSSIYNTVLFTLIGGGLFSFIFLLIHLLLNWLNWFPNRTILNTLSIGMLFGLHLGLFPSIPCIQHFALRLILWRNHSIPWNYARFISYAAKRRLIQQVGGRYQFIHGLMQEHFAKL